MTYYPLILVFILAGLNWIAVYKSSRTMEYIFKPATMLALLYWTWQSVGLGGSMLWFTIGVVFCLAGDVFLMIPRDFFIFGLVSFLLGHIAYIIGLNNQPPYFNLLGAALVVLLGIYMWWLYPKLVAGLNSKGKASLRIPVLIYALVISIMVYSAWMSWTRSGWQAQASLAVSLGAVLFFISDSILAWDRFVNPLSNARLKTMMTYHLGQIGIILGAILHLSLK
jgi:alkenylglycerophosphocholine/alkenylglycerophosphoethanolamine hydrolase